MQQFAATILPSAPLMLLARTLRSDQGRANDAPQDIAALLYSALRREQQSDDPLDDVLEIDAAAVPLRIVSYAPPTEGTARARVRPPGPVAAIHTIDQRSVTAVRCANALLILGGPDAVQTALTPRLTASALSADGGVVTGDAEGTVTFWTLELRLQRFDAHCAEITQVAISESTAFSCAADRTIVRWKRSGPEWILDAHLPDAPAAVSAAAVSDDQLIAGCRNGDIVVIAPDATTLHARAHDGAVTAVAQQYPSDRIVSVGADRALRQCPRSRPKAAVKVDSGHTMGISGMAVLAPTDFIATYAADRTVRLWRTGSAVKVLERHAAAVTAAAFGHAGKEAFLITASADGAVMLWDLDGNFIGSHHRHRGAVRACAFAGGEIMTGGDDRRLDRCDTVLVAAIDAAVSDCASVKNAIGICVSGRLRVWHDGDEMEGKEATSLALRSDGLRALAWRDGAVTAREWDIRTAKETPLPPFGARIVRCAYVGDTPVAALDSGELRTGPKLVTKIHDGAVTAMDTTSDMVITAGTDRKVVRTRVRGGVVADVTVIGGHAAPVTVVNAGNVSGASGSMDGEVAVWQGDTPRTAIFRGRHDAAVSHLAFANVPGRLVSAGEDNIVVIWDFLSGTRRATCQGHRDRITALVIDSVSSIIYTASLDGTVRAWDVDGNPRGVVYGDRPFSALGLIRGNFMAGEVLAGDDGGAVWAIARAGAAKLTAARPSKEPAAPRKKRAAKPSFSSSRRPSKKSFKKK